MIEQPSVGGRISYPWNRRSSSCIIFTERWLFWEIRLSSLKSRLARFAAPKISSRNPCFDSRRDLFTEVDLVFYDTSSRYFESEGGQSIGKRGHNKDHRPDLKQMVVGMAVDVQGRPMCCEMWPGNTADVTTLVPIVQRMRERFRLREITVVADRGMVSKATLEVFEKSDPPVHYVIGVRMRRRGKLIYRCSTAASRGLRAFRNGATPRIPHH